MKTFLFGNAKNKTETIVRIAIMLALTLLVQYLTGLAGIQLLTGSFVNMFLLITTMLCGLIGGIAVGFVTPFVGFGLGFVAAPSIAVVPFIGIANALLVVTFAVASKLLGVSQNKGVLYIIFTALAAVLAAGVKFLFMYYICAKLIFPLFLAEAIVNKLAVGWGTLQLFTALIGGGAATALSIPLRKLSIFNAAE